ncbi:MAG: magnesium transporter [Thioalkalivibrionaceae bacterium]
MEHNLDAYLLEIRELIDADDIDGAVETLSTMRVPDVAWILMELDVAAQLTLMQRFVPGRRADVFSYLDPNYQLPLLERLAPEEARYLLGELDSDDLTALLETLDEEQTRRFLGLLPFGAIRRALKQLKYPEESVGRRMSSDVVAVSPEWSLVRALAHIRRTGDEHSNNVIFVVDDERRLKAVLPIAAFLRGHPDSKVGALIDDESPVTIRVDDTPGEAARRLQHYDLPALPVIDERGVLLGIVTFDDVMDYLEAESTEDFHKLGSVERLDVSIGDASPWLLYRKRVFWLIGLVALNTVGGFLISGYEDAISAMVVLIFFLPLIIASGGNAGAQSATLMVRAIATGDVGAGDWTRLWAREVFVAASLGATMGVIVSLLGLWRGGPDIALLVALAMVIIVVVSSLIGMTLPILLNRLKLDPATASVPVMTSIADIGGILVYFSLALLIVQFPTEVLA